MAASTVMVAAIVQSRIRSAQLVTVTQFHKSLNSTCIQFPTVKVNVGEDRSDAALRGLKEQTGFSGRVVDSDSASSLLVLVKDPMNTAESSHLLLVEVDSERPGNKELLSGEPRESVELITLNSLNATLRTRGSSRKGVFIDSNLHSFTIGMERNKSFDRRPSELMSERRLSANPPSSDETRKILSANEEMKSELEEAKRALRRYKAMLGRRDENKTKDKDKANASAHAVGIGLEDTKGRAMSNDLLRLSKKSLDRLGLRTTPRVGAMQTSSSEGKFGSECTARSTRSNESKHRGDSFGHGGPGSDRSGRSDDTRSTQMRKDSVDRASAQATAKWQLSLADTQPVQCVIICDPGVDVHTEMAMVLLRDLCEKGHMECKGIVANLKPQLNRGLLLRGTLDALGMHDVPVGVGTNGGSSSHTDTFTETANEYIPALHSERAQTLWTGHRLLRTTFERAMPRSLVLLLLSSLKDAAVFLRDNETLFVSKVRTCVVMGGVEPFSDNPSGLLVPDSAQNNQYDKPAARFFYTRCQELGVPLIVISREAAYAVPVPRSMYDDMAKGGSPIGWRMRSAIQTMLQNLWKRACAPMPDSDSPDVNERHGLPSRCNKRWFCDTFCGGNGMDRTSTEPMWDLVQSLNMYDPIALVACVPELRTRYLDPAVKKVNFKGPHGQDCIEHLVVGAKNENRGIPDPAGLRTFLVDALDTGISLSERHAVPLIMISDPGQDQDDEMAMVMLRSLVEKGHVQCVGVVTNLMPARNRARLARGTLDELGLSAVPVATGSDGGSDKHKDTFSDTAGSYMPPDTEAFSSLTGEELLLAQYKSAPATGVALLCISSIKDAAAFCRSNEALFVQKTRSVTIMGGVEPFDPADTEKLLVPDTAQNNVFDKEAAAYFYRRCQELRVPLIVVSRHAAYKCPMPRSIYDDMAKTNHPIGKRLRDSQQGSIEHLWSRAAAPEGPGRLGLPMRCDKAWFCNTFCQGKGMDRDGSMSIWDLIVSFNMYDPMALLCVVEATREFFNPTTKWVNGVEHLVIGTSPENPGVNEDMVEELRDFMYTNFFRGITMDFSEFDGTFEAVAQSDQLNERSRRSDMAEARRKYGNDSASSMSSGRADTNRDFGP